MKTKITLLMIFSFLLFNCSSNDDNGDGGKEQKKIKIEFKNKEKQLLVNESFELLNELIMENVDPKTILWSGYNNKILQLEGSKVKAIAQGETTIIASVKNTDKTTSLKVVVSNVKVAFSKDKIEVEKKQSQDLLSLLVLENVKKEELTWLSENTDIVTVTNGVVTAVKEGETTIVALVKDKQVKGAIKVVVKPIEIKELAIVPSSIDMKVFEKKTVKLEVKPADADLKGIVWKSSNEKIARISDKGEIEALGVGEITITATAPNGKVAHVKVGVKSDGIYSIKAEEKEIEVVDGDIFTLKINVLPVDADRNDLEFISDNPNITVDQTGKVTTLQNKYGKATITVRSKKNNKVSDTIQLVVTSFYTQVTDNVKINNVTYKDGVLSGDLEFTVINNGKKDLVLHAFAVHRSNNIVVYGDSTKRTLKGGQTYTYTYKMVELENPYVRYQVAYRGSEYGQRTTLGFN